MEQRILEYTKHGYQLVGYTQGSTLLTYMQEFLENLSLEQALRGAQDFHLSQINDFMIEYNKKPTNNFYVAFWNLLDSSPYETEVNGITILHDEKIPKLKLSYKNFDYIFKQWAHIKQTHPQYVVIQQDDAGFVHLFDKSSLDIDELALVAQHKKNVARWNNERLKKIKSLN